MLLLSTYLCLNSSLRVGESYASEDTGAICKQGPRGDYLGNEYQCSGEAIQEGPPVVTEGRE